MPFQHGEGEREGPGHQLWLRSPPARGDHHRRWGDQCIWGLQPGGIDFARAHKSPLHRESKAAVSACFQDQPSGWARGSQVHMHAPTQRLSQERGRGLPVTPSSCGCWSQSLAGGQQQPRVRGDAANPTATPVDPEAAAKAVSSCHVLSGPQRGHFVKGLGVRRLCQSRPSARGHGKSTCREEERKGEKRRLPQPWLSPASGLLAGSLMKVLPSLPFSLRLHLNEEC